MRWLIAVRAGTGNGSCRSAQMIVSKATGSDRYFRLRHIRGKSMKRRKLLAILAPLAFLAMAESATAATLVVTKTAYCGCCKHWVEHMKKAGFQVEVREVEDVAPT